MVGGHVGWHQGKQKGRRVDRCHCAPTAILHRRYLRLSGAGLWQGRLRQLPHNCVQSDRHCIAEQQECRRQDHGGAFPRVPCRPRLRCARARLRAQLSDIPGQHRAGTWRCRGDSAVWRHGSGACGQVRPALLGPEVPDVHHKRWCRQCSRADGHDVRKPQPELERAPYRDRGLCSGSLRRYQGGLVPEPKAQRGLRCAVRQRDAPQLGLLLLDGPRGVQRRLRHSPSAGGMSAHACSPKLPARVVSPAVAQRAWVADRRQQRWSRAGDLV
mmetsp:Transcript_80333/g.225436  ORF Transcript_80333/g.225436 Transcript_80333/m.225436 type:complete len:271 (+) Transcript_80333:1352-2164(+)